MRWGKSWLGYPDINLSVRGDWEKVMQNGPAMSSFAMPSMSYFESGLKLLHTAGQLQAHVMSGVMRYQIETLAFLKHRCEQDVKLVDNFVGSGEFNDVFDIFSNFMQNATSDYTAEAGKIAAISSKLASKTAKHPREEADRTHRSATSRRHRGESHAKVIRSDPLRVQTRQAKHDGICRKRAREVPCASPSDSSF